MTRVEAADNGLAFAEASTTAPMTAGSVSVVICAYTLERWSDLQRAVASALEQRHPVREVIVVIDHNDELLQRASEALPAVRVIANREAKGLSGARNTGLAHATGAVVAFLDDDAVAGPTWASTLASGYDRAEVMGVGGLSEPDWVEPRPDWFPPEFDWVVGCSYLGMPTRPSPVRNMIGSNMSFRRSVFDLVGGFDSRVGRVGSLPAGCEETELCIRVRRRWPHAEIMYVPEARVRHRVPANRGSWRYFTSRCLAEGRSKARVSQLVGSAAGLSTERTYASRVLPAGVLRGLRQAAIERRAAPLARAGAIAAGLGMTTAGYVHGRIFGAAIDRRPRTSTRAARANE